MKESCQVETRLLSPPSDTHTTPFKYLAPCGFLLLGLFASLLFTNWSVAATAQTAKPAQIDKNGALILIKSALIALDQANKTGNYTVLRDLGAPGFQVNTAAKLAEIFANLRRDNLDLSGVVVIDPQLNMLPEIEPNGMLHMIGFFPSVPTQVNFELGFAPVGGQWRLFQIAISLGQAAPTAPGGPATPSPQAPPAAAQQSIPSKTATKPASKPVASPAAQDSK